MFTRSFITGLVLSMPMSVYADSIRCDGELFQDDQINPVSLGQVIETCGEPKHREGNTLVYEQPGGANMALHFNDAGELENIDKAGHQP